MGSKGGEINNAEVIFLVGNFSGYCGYCYNGVKDYDETGIDCGGSNCPSCGGEEEKEWRELISWILGLILIVLILIFLGYWYREFRDKE